MTATEKLHDAGYEDVIIFDNFSYDDAWSISQNLTKMFPSISVMMVDIPTAASTSGISPRNSIMKRSEQHENQNMEHRSHDRL